jgi:hypothetical protein
MIPMACTNTQFLKANLMNNDDADEGIHGLPKKLKTLSLNGPFQRQQDGGEQQQEEGAGRKGIPQGKIHCWRSG